MPQIEKSTAQKIQHADSVPEGNESILFVDDDKSLVHLGKRMLERFGYKVMTKTSSTEALEIFCSEPDKFDLVITDQTMPDMTGMEFAGELLYIRPDIPIILMTGFSETVTPEIAKEMGIRKYIMKPVILHDLAKAVRQVLNSKDEKEI